MIDISNKNKARVLMALYEGAKVQGMGFLRHDSNPMRYTEAVDLLKNQTFFDYHKGRVIKVDLSGDEFDPWGYDRDNGTGAAQRRVDSCPDFEEA